MVINVHFASHYHSGAFNVSLLDSDFQSSFNRYWKAGTIFAVSSSPFVEPERKIKSFKPTNQMCYETPK